MEKERMGRKMKLGLVGGVEWEGVWEGEGVWYGVRERRVDVWPGGVGR